MPIQHLTNRYLNYNLWAIERLTTWLLTIERDKLYEKTGSSFRTIDLTLQHILAAQRYWHAILVEKKLIEFNAPTRHNEVEEVIDEMVKAARELITILSALSEQQLMETIRVSDSTQNRYEYILHLVNHTTYHRGQVVTMCRALGVTGEIPPTDYDAYLWWIENT